MASGSGGVLGDDPPPKCRHYDVPPPLSRAHRGCVAMRETIGGQMRGIRALAVAMLVLLLLGLGSVVARSQTVDPIYRDTQGVCFTTQFRPVQIIHCGVMPGF